MARKLIVEIVGDSSSYERALGRSAKATQGFNGTVRNLGTGVRTFARNSALLVGAAAGIAGVVGIRSVKAASDLNEEVNKTSVVFGRSSDALIAWSKTTASSIGISQAAALEAAGNFGNMFATIGIGEQEAADMSKRFVTLAADIASFSNEDPSDMLLRLRSGLAGEAEPLRRFGILLSAARVEQEAVRLGLARAGDELTEQQKVQARYSLILQDSRKAQGDFARTSDSFANAQRRVRAQLEDSAATIGTALLPVAARALDAFSNFLPTLQSSLGNIAGAIGPRITQLADAIIPVITGIVDTVRSRLPELRQIFFSVMGPIQTFIVPILRDIAGIWRETWSGIVGVLAQNREQIRTILNNLGEVLQNVWNVARPTIVFLFTKALPTAINIAIPIVEKISGVIKVMSNVFVGSVKVILRAIDGFLGGLTSLTDALSHLPFIGDKFAGVSDAINAARESLQSFVTELDSVDGKTINVAVNIAVDTTTGRREEGALGRRNTNPVEDIQKQVTDRVTSSVRNLTTSTNQLTGATNESTAAAKKGKTAAEKAQDAYDQLMDSLSLKLDRAGTTRTFRDDIRVLERQKAAILARIKAVGRTTELLRELQQNTQALAQARRDANKAAAFQALGLTPEGEERVPGAGSLLKRARTLQTTIRGTVLDTAKTRRQLRLIVNYLKKNLKSAGREVRQAILQMLNDIAGSTDSTQAQGPLTKTSGLNSKKIIEGLGLSPEEARALQARLSHFNTAGRALRGASSGSTRPTGRFADNSPIVVNTTVNIDGKKVATSTTKHQQRDQRRNPPQKRGPNARAGR